MVRIQQEKILLRPEDIAPSSDKVEVIGVLNPAAVRLPNGTILLYARVIEKLKIFEDSRYFYSPRMVGKNNFKLVIDKFCKTLVSDHTDVDFNFFNGTKRLMYISHLRRVHLDKNGFTVLKIDKKPSFFGLASDSELGVEDARISKIGGLYYMTYVGLTRRGNISTNLAVSKDCLSWKRNGIIFGEQDKDAVLFPEKINGNFVVFDRPEGGFEFTPPHMWIAYSPDGTYWGKPDSVKIPLDAKFNRSGAGPPPLKTEKGWLLIFHAVTTKKHKTFVYRLRKFFGLNVGGAVGYSREDVYSVWTALFDARDPAKLVALSPKPILYPHSKENTSFEGKEVIFPTGMVRDRDGKSVLLFSGLGDTLVGASKIKLKTLLKTLKRV